MSMVSVLGIALTVWGIYYILHIWVLVSSTLKQT